MRIRWGVGGLVVVLMVLMVRAWGQVDPEEVRKKVEMYERQERESSKPTPKPHPKPAPAPKPAVNYDHEAWKSAEKCGTAVCFRAYLKKHPQGEYAEIARARLESEVEPAVVTPTPTVRPPSSSSAPKMVRISEGCFQMGSPPTEAGREPGEANEQQHQVCVQAFELGKYEVTVGEFRRFVTATGYRTDAEKNEGCAVWNGTTWNYTAGLSWRSLNFKQGDDHPVVCVSWNDAQAYVEWLSQVNGQRYRLPMEAEWEYAARAGTTTARYWGDNPDAACQYANVADRTLQQTFPNFVVHNCTDGYVYTAPVDSFQANRFGLYGMLGNAWEWTCSLYHKDYDDLEQSCTNKDKGGPLAVRGGGWDGIPVWVRSAYRSRVVPTGRDDNQGFRLARSL